MNNELRIYRNKLELSGFPHMTDFTLSFLAKKVVIFPKLLHKGEFRFPIPQGELSEIDTMDIIEAIKSFYGISDDNFTLLFEQVPPENNYVCFNHFNPPSEFD